MSLQLRNPEFDQDGRLQPAIYESICGWWSDRDGHAPTREMLGQCGIIIDLDGEPIACAWMYLDGTGSGVAWMAWLATKPGANGNKAARAVRMAIDFLCEHAKSLNYWCVQCAYNNPSIIKMLKSADFRQVDGGMSHLVKPL